MLKFILGPLGGYAAGLNLITTILATVLGMMTVVFAFAFFGNWLRDKIVHKIFKKGKLFSGKNRRFVYIWRKYGLTGVAALTPILLTPIGGTLLAIGFGAPKDKLIIYMFISASIWAVIFSLAIYMFGDSVVPEVIRPEQ